MRPIQLCNRWDRSHFIPLWIDGERVGNLKPKSVEALLACSTLFKHDNTGLVLDDGSQSFSERTEFLDHCVDQLMLKGFISRLWGERYPLAGRDRTRPVATIDRAVASWFGARAYGQHLNGYVNHPENGLSLWIARRAFDRIHFPGKLDNMVAGGLPVGLSLQQNLIKECAEEASLPEALAQRAIAVGSISYCVETANGLKPDTLFCYDLEMPSDFIPENSDGEVDSFQLTPVAEVARLVTETDEFKLNCNLVIIDFLIRHGFIDPENGEYGALVAALHRSLPGDVT
jgi:isopentenyldiphosphate isomerase